MEKGCKTNENYTLRRRDNVLLATLELASGKGLGNISLSQIKVGVQKATLYSHFSSKEEIINCLYEYLRNNAKSAMISNVIDYGEIVNGKNALDVLIYVVESYKKMNTDENIKMFYKFVMSEKSFNKEAAKIILKTFAQSGMQQLLVTTPIDSPYSDICIVHLNYGGWRVQDISMRELLKDMCVSEGYSHVQFAGIGGEDGLGKENRIVSSSKMANSMKISQRYLLSIRKG